MSHHTCQVVLYNEDETEEYTLEVEYDFQPPEPKVMYDRNGGGNPGWPATLEVTSTKLVKFTVFTTCPTVERIVFTEGVIWPEYAQQIEAACWKDVDDRAADALALHEAAMEDRNRG